MLPVVKLRWRTRADVHLWVHADSDLLRVLQHILKNQETTLADLSALEAAVEANTDAEQSAIALITKIAADLAAAADDPAEVQALADRLNESAAALAAAVVANTPAGGVSPPPVVEPSPEVPAEPAPPAE